ncbi:hypothetical protein J6K67_10135 [Leuconostoc mesenteroides]|uniref:hypothetical protein n=1 Tax=Leuconostoc TaxID=1243 RepID=UPI001CBDF0A0|nr:MULTISPECIES: hypothetical protein [Leuconostoc]MBZ1517277.1 hypothetical protein [Leuconostoc mesenteroides]MBZ1541583.1 hypothetical protein [Leuconostoc mesenteroides]MBZ5983284.1 hypothetical protein [Leuconostoc gasicomitatum]MCT3073996.1 hypothetical protein [Leuconostoc citreum]
MDKQMTELIRVRLRNQFEWSKLSDKNMSIKTHALLTMIGYLVAFVLVIGYAVSLPYQMNQELQLDMVNPYVFSLLFWVLGIWMLLSGVKNILVGFDHDQLFVLPIEEWKAKLVNIFSSYVIYFVLCGIVLFCIQISLFIFQPFPLINLLIVGIYVIMIPLLAIGSSIIVSLLVKWFLSLLRFRNTLVETVLTLLIFIAPLLYGYYSSNSFDAKSGFINSSLLSISLLHKVSVGYWIKIVFSSILVIAIFYSLCVFIVRQYPKISNLLVIQIKGDPRFVLKVQPKFLRILTREIKHFFSSFTYVVNSTISPVVLVVLCSGLLAGLLPNIQKFVINQLNLTITGSSIYLILIIIFMNLTTSTSCSFSFEGKNIWIIQSLPISVFELSLAKILVNLILYIPGLILASIVCWHTLQLRGFHLTVTILYLLISLIFISILGTLLNLLFPNFAWTSEMVVVKQSLSTILTAVISTSFISLTIVFFLLFGTIGLGIMSLIELLTSFVAIFKISKFNYI